MKKKIVFISLLILSMVIAIFGFVYFGDFNLSFNNSNSKNYNVNDYTDGEKFDLSLREYISKVERNGEDVSSSVITASREPVVQDSPNDESTTKVYVHTKDAIEVKKDDIITYTLRVYNESEISGYANEVTSFYSDGLEFVDNEFNQGYKWEEVTDNDENVIGVKSSYLASSDNGGSEDNLLAENGVKEIKLQLKVTKSANNVSRDYLTVRSEITNSGYYNNTTWTTEDRDSTVGSIANNLGLDKWYSSHVVNSSPNITNYYEGKEDDDDFETVYLEKVIAYSVQMELDSLSSTDNENIEYTKFKVTSSDIDSSNIKMYKKSETEDGYEEIELDEDGNFEVAKAGAILQFDNLEKSSTYELNIEQVTSPNGFTKKLTSFDFEISLDENGTPTGTIKKVTDRNGEEQEVSEQTAVVLKGANENGSKILDGTNENLTTKYRIGEEGVWQDYTESFKVNENTKVYAKTTDGENESGIAIKVINNIDKTAPTIVSTEEVDLNSTEVELNINITDDASGIVKYGLSNSDTVEPEEYEITNQELEVEETIEGITENGTYYLWVWDAAGNHTVSEAIVVTKVQEIMVARIVSAPEGYEDLVGTEYRKLSLAIEACPELSAGETTIEIIHDIANEANEVKKDIVIDLNGFTITNKSRENPAFVVDEGGDLTIINGESTGAIISKNTTAIQIEETGTLTLGVNDRRVLANQPTIVGNEIGINNNGTFNFYDGNITAVLSIGGLVTDTPIAYTATVTQRRNYTNCNCSNYCRYRS